MSNRRKLSRPSGPPALVYPDRPYVPGSVVALQLEILAALPQPIEGTCPDCIAHLFVWEADTGGYGWRQHHQPTCPVWLTAAAAVPDPEGGAS